MSRKEFFITIIVVFVLLFVVASRLYESGRSRNDFSDLMTPGVIKMATVQQTPGANAELRHKK